MARRVVCAAAFEVELAPITWKRTSKVRGRSLTPKKQRAYQKALAWLVLSQRPRGWPLDVKYRERLEVHRARELGDVDRYENNVLDALTGVLWNDDRQVRSSSTDVFETPELPGLVLSVEAYVVESVFKRA